MRDDAVGLHVVRQVRQRLPEGLCVEVRESTEMGLALLDYVTGFDELVIVDAVQTGTAQPGTVHVFDPADFKPARLVSPHLVGVSEMLALGQAIGLAMPQRVTIYGIEVADLFTVDTRLTADLQRALPAIVERVTAGVLDLATAANLHPQHAVQKSGQAPEPPQPGI